MIIILEGPDNGGKTTLAKFLSTQTGLRLHHSGGPPKDRSEILYRATELLKLENVIFDRFPVISDRIYSKLLRGEDFFANTTFPIRLAQQRPFIIYCRPPMEVLLKLDGHEVKEHETQEHVEAMKKKALDIVIAYDQAMKAWDPLYYDYTIDHSAVDEMLIRYIQLRVQYDKAH